MKFKNAELQERLGLPDVSSIKKARKGNKTLLSYLDFVIHFANQTDLEFEDYHINDIIEGWQAYATLASLTFIENVNKDLQAIKSFDLKYKYLESLLNWERRNFVNSPDSEIFLRVYKIYYACYFLPEENMKDPAVLLTHPSYYKPEFDADDITILYDYDIWILTAIIFSRFEVIDYLTWGIHNLVRLESNLDTRGFAFKHLPNTEKLVKELKKVRTISRRTFKELLRNTDNENIVTERLKKLSVLNADGKWMHGIGANQDSGALYKALRELNVIKPGSKKEAYHAFVNYFGINGGYENFKKPSETSFGDYKKEFQDLTKISIR